MRKVQDANGAGTCKMRRETFRNIQGAVQNAHDANGAGIFKMSLGCQWGRNRQDEARKFRMPMGAKMFKMGHDMFTMPAGPEY